MAIIAAHHLKSHPLPRDTEYRLVCAWPADCRVQWGAPVKDTIYGIPLEREAFFEAFPRQSNGPTYIRGEGASIEEAERAAFTKFSRFSSCKQHAWSRGKYLNGGGTCRNCGAWASDVFPSIDTNKVDLNVITPDDLDHIGIGLIQERTHDRMAHSKFDPTNLSARIMRKRLSIKARRAGLVLPSPELDQDTYDEACKAAVAAWWAIHRERFMGYPAYKIDRLDHLLKEVQRQAGKSVKH